MAAEPEVVQAAVRGLARARAWRESPPEWLSRLGLPDASQPDPVIMVSVTLAGDRHTQIAVVDEPDCIRCDVCTPSCPPGSIVNGDVQASICTGCNLCVVVCPTSCISLKPRETDPRLSDCWDAGARALEIHTGAADRAEVQDWQPIARNWQKQGGLLAYSIDGQQLGYPRALALAKEVGRPGIIIQADGKPISGVAGERSTVPALRIARAMIRAGVPAWIQPSGGTNDQTGPLADRHHIAISGVGVGSFARQAARALEQGDDSPGAWASAYSGARSLVRSIQPTAQLTTGR